MSALSALPSLERARVVGAYAQAAIDEAGARGLSPQALGLAAAMPAELSVSQYIELLESAARRCGDPAFGLHVGERMRPATFATYAHVVLSAPSFGEAIRHTQRFEGLAHDLGRTELLRDGATAIYRWHCPWLELLPSRHLPESVVAGIVCFANWLACARLPLIEVAFAHAQDPAVAEAEYQRLFAAPVRFGAAVTEARFPAAVLEIGIPNADARLLPLVERHAESLLAEREAEMRLDQRVLTARRALAQGLAQEAISLSDTARALGLAPRTLQRHLAQAGTSHAQLLDAVRRELALGYLRDPNLSLTEIAFLLGYREQSSFTHAFRAWHGCSPQQWRQLAG